MSFIKRNNNNNNNADGDNNDGKVQEQKKIYCEGAGRQRKLKRHGETGEKKKDKKFSSGTARKQTLLR